MRPRHWQRGTSSSAVRRLRAAARMLSALPDPRFEAMWFPSIEFGIAVLVGCWTGCRAIAFGSHMAAAHSSIRLHISIGLIVIVA